MLLWLTLGTYAQYSTSVYAPLEKNYGRFKTPLGSLLLLWLNSFINSYTTNSYHFQEESIPLSSQEGENQTSSNFTSSYILKCPLYHLSHCIPVCSLEIPLTRRVSWGYSYSGHVGKTTNDYADSLVLSSFSLSSRQFMWWQMLSTKMDSYLRPMDFFLLSDNEKQVKSRWFQQVKKYRAYFDRLQWHQLSCFSGIGKSHQINFVFLKAGLGMWCLFFWHLL